MSHPHPTKWDRDRIWDRIQFTKVLFVFNVYQVFFRLPNHPSPRSFGKGTDKLAINRVLAVVCEKSATISMSEDDNREVCSTEIGSLCYFYIFFNFLRKENILLDCRTKSFIAVWTELYTLVHHVL